jgi:hypothetical protein
MAQPEPEIKRWPAKAAELWPQAPCDDLNFDAPAEVSP